MRGERELQPADAAVIGRSRVRGPVGTRRGDLEFGTIGRMVRVAADRYPEADALVDGTIRLTFSQLADAVDGSCRAAMAHGLEPGDAAAVWAPNMAEWVVAALGLVSAGGVLVPLNTRFKGAEAAWILARSRARALFCVNGFLGNDYVAMLDRLERPAPGPADHRRRPRRGAGRDRRLVQLPGRRVARRRRCLRGPHRGGRVRCHLRHLLHLGHDRPAQGRHDQPRPDPRGSSPTGST